MVYSILLLLLEYNFGFVHIKAVDDAGHDKSLDRKIEFFKKTDDMVKVIIETLHKRNKNNDEFIIALTGDHTTPLISGDHTFEPVPFTATTYSALLENLGIEKDSKRIQELKNIRDNVEKFDEVSACEGVLGRFPGSEMMGVLKNLKKVVEGVLEKTG